MNTSNPSLLMEESAASVWISVEDLALLAGIQKRKARLALSICFNGGTWRQHSLIVRTKNGGPPSAQNIYQVRIDSLPPALSVAYMQKVVAAYEEEPIKVSPMPAIPTNIDINGIKKMLEMEWKLKLLSPAMEFCEGTFARAQALRDIAAKKHLCLDGRARQIKIRTLQSWITRIKNEKSVYGLIRKCRQDKPDRYYISRVWDSACPLPAEIKQQIANEIQGYVRSLWAAGSTWSIVEQFASSRLMETSRSAGWIDANYDTCRVGRYYVEKHSSPRLIAIKDKDAKRWHDQFVPRIKRTREGLRPGDIVVGDVHPVDVLVRREDGSEATYRLIAWYDIATGDLFGTLVLLAAGKGITQIHIAASFAAMVESWGLPRLLMLDNGSEYCWRELENGFRQLVQLSRGFDEVMRLVIREEDEALPFVDEPEDLINKRHSPVLRALPYRPCSKPIEGIFAVLEQSILKQFPGWIGGDRMNKRTHRMGKKPRPFSGSPAQFESIFNDVLRFWRIRERNAWNGRSIIQVRKAFQSDGGPLPASVPRPVVVFALSERVDRIVSTWGVEIDGMYYRSDLLIPFTGQKVTLHYAKWAPEYIFMVGKKGELTRIDRLLVFNYTDRQGTHDQARLNYVLNTHIRDLRAGTRKVDILAEMTRHSNVIGENVVVLKGSEIQLTPELETATLVNRAVSVETTSLTLGYGESINNKDGERVSMIPDHYAKTISLPEEQYDDDDIDWVSIGARLRLLGDNSNEPR